MNIAIDIMGGDFAPQSTLSGAIEARKELPKEVILTLIGDEKQIKPALEEAGMADKFGIIHTDEVIGMGEHPTKALMQKPKSSIGIGFHLLTTGKVDAFASAGNSGAMFVGAVYSVKPIPGISRPPIATLVPKESGGYGLMLDVGANADCKPELLQEFALLGSVYAKAILEIENPKVGLMNIGEEAEKGNLASQTAHKLLSQQEKINFIGNIEGRDLFNAKADVIVTDGFTGNIILKSAESFYSYLRKYNFTNDFFDRFNYENYGGSPILGVNAPVIIGHGISNSTAIKNMILQAYQIKSSNLTEKIKKIFS
ncbi:MAG: glycerol-3-phosphate acyltransferase PlsX [Sphingobacteriales bacterium]|jgi:glycerol-3-phosphate acyltransferase PlsX